MKRITVDNKPLIVTSGRVNLTGAQAVPRMAALSAVGKLHPDGGGVFDVIAPLQFKIGETIGFDGEVRKDGVLFDPQAAARDLADQTAANRAVIDAAVSDERTALAQKMRAAVAAIEGIPEGARKLVLASVDSVFGAVAK